MLLLFTREARSKSAGHVQGSQRDGGVAISILISLRLRIISC